ncbi:DEAD-domain-containing protein [Neoconidiobolus thromboides FSU 785]|nr:DEAD-domain-containing protein [Neoconidiobolus thromboides FSU 785]
MTENSIKREREELGLTRFEQEFEDLETKKKEFKTSKLGLPNWLANPTIIDNDEAQDITELTDVLNQKLIEGCNSINITSLFAVQKAVLPILINSNYLSTRYFPGDLCVSAPTGSGKTLAYVLPIIQNLMPRVVVRLRALVLLPTYDLVAQVRETFAYFCKGTDLKVAGIYKMNSFQAEQGLLVNELNEDLLGGSSKVDILITTPGRLMDHISKTKNFSLQHLRYLVIDEADRLLNQTFYDWLNKVLDAVDNKPSLNSKLNVNLNSMDVSSLRHDAVNQEITVSEEEEYQLSSRREQLQKLLFSATLTRNPGKISNLKLKEPKYIVIQPNGKETIRYNTPKSLVEKYVACSPSYKPILLLYLLNQAQLNSVLVFTKSINVCDMLLNFINEYVQSITNEKEKEYLLKLNVKSYHSELSRKQKLDVLKGFKKNEINVLICSDLLARGLDVDNVEGVINYDAPQFIKQYIHRVGRTARANQDGLSITMLELHEVTSFRNMQAKASRLEFLKQMHVAEKEFKPWKLNYQETLKKIEFNKE